MNRNNLLLLTALFIGVLYFSACEKDPEVPQEEELITTLTAVLTPVGGGTAVTLNFSDIDGDGGAAPVITGGTLAAGTTYTAAITLLNESESPAEDITEEIEMEDDEHQFFFAVSSGLNVAIAYADQDADGNPVGLASTWVAGTAGSGNVTITLRHEPNKNATGVKDGDITNAGGETDIEVTFPVTIQ
ncbi:MAG: type 1 periplasmic binding fold superfamily protein [Saprospiraceae bacterium]